MLIYCEDSMPYAQDYFGDMGDCRIFSHKTIDAQQLAQADILLVRSTTKVNHNLLHLNHKLKFVGTATAGTNHLDKAYLAQRGIPWGSAAGCNAVAVAEYVLSALFTLSSRQHWPLADKTVGIVGAGNVGSVLASKLAALGVNYRLCDPPLADSGDKRDFVSLDEIMQCDIISLHVPLLTEGNYPTAHMFDAQRLAKLRPEQLLINACRGEVLDNAAALALVQQGKPLNLVLDVWENEPEILTALVPYVALATAHIAGHSIEGKANGTDMLYRQLCQLLRRPVQKSLQDYLPQVQNNVFDLSAQPIDLGGLGEVITKVYNIAADDSQFKASVSQSGQFAYIRKHYPIRREFSAFAVNTGNSPLTKAIYDLGFSQPF